MICVSVSRPRHRFMIAEFEAMAQRGADLVELRVDALVTVVDFKRLLKKRYCPVIATCRRKQDGGNYKRTETERIILLRTAVFEGVDYVDLEMDVASQIPRYGKTKRIISWHDFDQTPDNLEEIHKQMMELDPDVIKICTMARSQEDNVRILELVKNSSVPTVGFCMGDFGTPSRVLCGAYGSPFTYACPDGENSAAPGQIPFDTMKRLYQYNDISPRTAIYGVIADPIGHSLSPQIHNSAYAANEMGRVYLPFRVTPDQLDSFITNVVPKLKIEGLSVTIPHKEKVIPLLDATDPAVDVIGACNTIVCKDGKKTGYNTDCQAAMDAISGIFGWTEPLAIESTPEGNKSACSLSEETVPTSIASVETGRQITTPSEGILPFRCVEQPLQGKKVLLLGAGGVGKALAMGLKLRGADLFITDIDAHRAIELSRQVNGVCIPWDNRGQTQSDLIINCTPVGMFPNQGATPYNEEWFIAPQPGQTLGAFDCVYNPEMTMFLKAAQTKGWKIASGLDMFVGQACLQFEHFIGIPAPKEVMRDAVRKATSDSDW